MEPEGIIIAAINKADSDLVLFLIVTLGLLMLSVIPFYGMYTKNKSDLRKSQIELKNKENEDTRMMINVVKENTAAFGLMRESIGALNSGIGCLKETFSIISASNRESFEKVNEKIDKGLVRVHDRIDKGLERVHERLDECNNTIHEIKTLERGNHERN